MSSCSQRLPALGVLLLSASSRSPSSCLREVPGPIEDVWPFRALSASQRDYCPHRSGRRGRDGLAAGRLFT
jgi:hypothetical protein